MKLSSIICVATQKYQWMLWPYSLMLWKYWGREIQIIYYGDKVEEPLPPGVVFRPIPIMRERSEDQWNWIPDFGAGVASILREMSDPIVALSLPDMWLVDHARLDVVDSLVGYMESHSNVVHASMCNVQGAAHCTEYIETWEGLDIVTCSSVNSFQGGLMLEPSLWNRELALELIPDIGIWEFELMGKMAMDKRQDLMSVWVKYPPEAYPYVHVSHRAESEKLYLDKISREEDREIIKAFIPEHICPINSKVRDGREMALTAHNLDLNPMKLLVEQAMHEPPAALMYRLHETYAPYYHLMYLLVKAMVAQHPIQDRIVCVELGMGEGHGAAALAAASPKAHVYGIDHKVRAGVPEVLRTYTNVTFLHRLTLPASLHQLSPIDILHIDANPTYDEVKAEFEAYAPGLAPGAVVLFGNLHRAKGIKDRDGIMRYYARDGVLRYFNSIPWPKLEDDRLHPKKSRIRYDHRDPPGFGIMLAPLGKGFVDG